MSLMIRMLLSPASSAAGPSRRGPSRPAGSRTATGPEQAVERGTDPADRDARDVVLAVGEHDSGRALRVGGKVLRRRLDRRDVVRVDADLLGQGRVEALAVGGGQAPQAVRELATVPRRAQRSSGRCSRDSRRPGPRTGPAQVVSPATRSGGVASTRSAIRSSAAANRSRFALSAGSTPRSRAG